MRHVSTEERRNRLVTRHCLHRPAGRLLEAATSVVALHSSDPATVFLSMWARVGDFQTKDLEKALYNDKTLIRILGMRRTMWVVPTELAGDVNSSSTAALIPGQRRRFVDMLETSDITDDGEEWVDRVCSEVLASLEERGEATARELKEDVPDLGHKIPYYKKDGTKVGEFGVSTRVLFLLATEAKVVRTRPLGSWLSSQYRWTRVEDWLGGPIPQPEKDDAQDEILQRWLWSFGPGTETDMKWWTGWPVTQVRKSLERIEAVEVELDEGTGWVGCDDVGPVGPPGSSVALLPSLDPTTMGWKEREWYLPENNQDHLFDRSGNAGPTVWVDGRVVGGWSQRDDGPVVFELFEEVEPSTRKAIENKSTELSDWLGEVNVTARFRSRHDKSLSSS